MNKAIIKSVNIKLIIMIIIIVMKMLFELEHYQYIFI